MNIFYKSIVKHLTAVILVIIYPSLNAASIKLNEDLVGSHKVESFFPYAEMLKPNGVQILENIKSDHHLLFSLVKENKLSQAKETATLLIKKNPGRPSYHNFKALLDIIDNDPASAMREFLKAIAIDDTNVAANIGLAELLLKHKQYNQAQKYVNKALVHSEQKLTSAYVILAKIELQQGNINLAEKILLDAKNKVSLNDEIAILSLLSQVYSRAQPEKLLPLARGLLKRNKGVSAAISFLAKIQIEVGYLEEAEKNLRKIIDKSPKDAKHQFMLARLLSEKADRDSEVILLLDQAISNLKNPIAVLIYKTSFLIKHDQFQRAYKIAKKVDTTYPKLSAGKLLKGDIYLAERKHKEAIEAFYQAYKISPDIKVLDIILNIFNQDNDKAGEVQFLEKEFKKNKSIDIQYRLADAYLKSNKYQLSIKNYEELLKTSDNIMFQNNLALAYSHLGNPRSLELARIAYKKAPDIAAIADTYGYILLKNGYAQDSLKILKHAATLDPDRKEIILHLAESYIKNKNKSLARNLLKKIIDKKGEKELVQATIKLMELSK